MKNLVVVGLLVFLIYMFVIKKQPATVLSTMPAGNNYTGTGNLNPNGGANTESAIVGQAGAVINNLIDNIFSYASDSSAPNTNPPTT